MIAIRIVVTLFILLYASILDWRHREIDNKSWAALLLLGFIFFVYDSVFGFGAPARFIVSIIAIAVIVFPLHYLRMMGGGDAKVLVGIASVFPFYPRVTLTLFPFFAFSVLVNGIFIAASASIFFLFNNMRHIREIDQGELKFIFQGYKRKLSEIKEYEVPLKIMGDEAWVSPALPFMIPLTVGFVLSIYWGDIPSYLLLLLR
ncbi:MAG: prepilin peptidase [Candidatus Hydrothermarchaeales archaeon]